MTLNNDNNNECCKCTTPEIYIELNQQGPQGRQGNPGVDGVSPEITVAQNTNTSYVLKIEDANGSFTTPNLKASLPLGGVDGQMLVKLSNEDGVVGWEGNIDNLVTLDGEQTIEGEKNFTANNTSIKQSLTFTDNNFNRINATQNGLGIYVDKNDSGTPNYLNMLSVSQDIVSISPFDETRNTQLVINSSANVPLVLSRPTEDLGYLHQGNVTAGENVTINKTDNGGIEISSTTESYTLPIASTTTLGGIKVGENLSITEDGTLSATSSSSGTTDYTQLTNKPQINGVELTGNQNSTTLGLANNSEVQALSTQLDTLEVNATTQGNTFNGANQLVQLDSSGKLPAIDGSQLTNLPSGNQEIESIPVGSDFNNFLSTGIYFWPASGGISNNPNTNMRGYLQVFRYQDNTSLPVVQLYYTCDSTTTNPPEIWIRYCINGNGGYTWTTWNKVNNNSVPNNVVTTDTQQTITGIKTFDKIILPDDSFSKGIYIGDNSNPSINAYNGSLSISDISTMYINDNIVMNGDSPEIALGNYENSANFQIKLQGYNNGNTKNYQVIQASNNDKSMTFGNTDFQLKLQGSSIVNSSNQAFVNTNNSTPLTIWRGTQSEYDGITSKDENTLYIITG